ncbi:glycosyl hydrolase [Plectosphaerella cucumerina]|uniref:Glycosyl hydrolase n=1 Tax=Plectosphaerella cucumerina TaxID=40658 RepID=A0A8K0X588_9PEZI|nr:glycosyl hydrolase [Plectosphaerella cucumerina]
MSTVVYRNPAVPGFNPDPSVVFVDGIFYLVTSTFHLFPGLPIYASANLRDWKLIGHGIHRQDQLSLANAFTKLVQLDTGKDMVATGGLQAPTIRHHAGKFYILCTNIVRNKTGPSSRDNFIISTTDIWSGQWSDPVPFEFHGIDPSLFVDDDGKTYVQGAYMHDRREQPTSTIYQVELDLETGKALSDTKSIWEGHFRYDTEGPHVSKRGGWYYLLAAEGGTFEHHKVTMARARDIWGPYESFDGNPVLTAGGKDEEIQGLGHAELFQDADGDWWAVALGFRSHDGVWQLGRETFLAQAEWPDKGWPKIEQPVASFEAKVVAGRSELPHGPEVSDLVHIRGKDEASYEMAVEESVQVWRLRLSKVLLTDTGGLPTFIGRRQHGFSSSAEAVLDIEKGGEALAGFALYFDPLRHAYLGYDFKTRQLVFKVVSTPKSIAHEVRLASESKGQVRLRVAASVEGYVFSYASPDSEWQKAGSVVARNIWTRYFTGPVMGVFAEGEAGKDSRVTFRGFKTTD